MKYGLPREEKPRRTWKNTVENELRCLQMEVCFLKDQLDETTKKLTELTSLKPADPFAFIQGFARSNDRPLFQFSKNNIENLTSINDPLPPFAIDLNGNKNHKFFTCSAQSTPQEGLFSSVGNGRGTTPYLYQSTMITRFGKEYGSKIVSITAMPEYESKSLEELRFEDYNIAAHNSPEQFFNGSERTRYQSTWDYEIMTRKAVRYHSITCMPSFKDYKSFEELRFEDYVLKGIGFSNQIKRYNDSQKRSSRTETNSLFFTQKNLKPVERKHSEGFTNHNTSFIIPWYTLPKLPRAPWPFGPSSKSNESSNSPVSENLASSTCSLDVIVDSSLEDEQNRYQPSFTFRNNSEPKNNLAALTTRKDENLSSEVILELKKMGEKISSINDKLSKMNSNLSDVSSRVNVMDSRLSAVDMFVTMQRFDKTWQGLEPRLAHFETSSPGKVVNLQDTSKDTSHPLSKGSSIEESILPNEKEYKCTSNNDKNKLSVVGKSDSKTLKDNIKNEAESLSDMDTSDMNLSDFVRSISCSDITVASKSLNTHSSSENSDVSDSSSKSKLKIASIEMTDFKSNSLSLGLASIGDTNSRDNESINSNSESVSAKIDNISKEGVNHKEETQVKRRVMYRETKDIADETKQVQKPKSQLISFDMATDDRKNTNELLSVTEQKDSSPKPNELMMKDIENDVDSEFVIVEKSDIEDSLDDSLTTNTPQLTTKCHQDEASPSSEFKMYSDITEYLEINLGKKKNVVYEFGFEAKPDYLPESEESLGYESKPVENMENKNGSLSRDDSFQQFKTNFIENKSVDAKQSSPFVFDPKRQEDSKVQNGMKNRRVVRCRRLRMFKK